MVALMTVGLWRVAGLLLVGLLVPGGSLIVLSALLAERARRSRSTPPVPARSESQ